MMMMALMNLLMLPVVVVGFRLTLVGFNEELSMFARKLAGVGLLSLAAMLFGLLIVIN